MVLAYDERLPDLEITAGLCPWGKITTCASNDLNLKPCTLKDVARLAAVSTATVSRVLNGSTGVSAKTANKVMTAISRLRYAPNAHAAELGQENRGIPKKRKVHTPALGRSNRTIEI